MITEYLNFINESRQFKIGDTVWIHYWVTNDLCQVEILEKAHGKVRVSYNVPESPYAGAPEEWIKLSSIVSRVKV